MISCSEQCFPAGESAPKPLPAIALVIYPRVGVKETKKNTQTNKHEVGWASSKMRALMSYLDVTYNSSYITSK